MRNGEKNYYNKLKIVRFLSKILIIIFCGILLYNILTIKKPKITLSINYNNVCINIKSEEPITATLYQEEIATPPVVYSDCASTFINARAMVIGDSTAEGLEAYQVLDASSVVWTRGRCVQYMQEDMPEVINYNPNVLFLAYGANDLLSWNGNVDGYINAYSNILNYIASVLPNTKICVNSILPVSDDAANNNVAYTYEKEFNTRLKELCSSLGVTYIDNRELLKQNNGGKMFESDGVHPKPFYYKLWASNMIEKSGI